MSIKVKMHMPNVTSSNSQKPKDSPFIVKTDQEKQQIFTFEKLESASKVTEIMNRLSKILGNQFLSIKRLISQIIVAAQVRIIFTHHWPTVYLTGFSVIIVGSISQWWRSWSVAPIQIETDESVGELDVDMQPTVV